MKPTRRRVIVFVLIFTLFLLAAAVTAPGTAQASSLPQITLTPTSIVPYETQQSGGWLAFIAILFCGMGGLLFAGVGVSVLLNRFREWRSRRY